MAGKHRKRDGFQPTGMQLAAVAAAVVGGGIGYAHAAVAATVPEPPQPYDTQPIPLVPPNQAVHADEAVKAPLVRVTVVPIPHPTLAVAPATEAPATPIEHAVHEPKHAKPSATVAQSHTAKPVYRPRHVAARTADPVVDANGRSGVVAKAMTQLGVPYVWGGASPSGFDCSGLVQWAFARAGYRLPRFSGDQAHLGTPVPFSELEPGDLVAWRGHIAIWVGGGRIVEAPRPGVAVRVRTFGTQGTWDAGAWGVRLNYAHLSRA